MLPRRSTPHGASSRPLLFVAVPVILNFVGLLVTYGLARFMSSQVSTGARTYPVVFRGGEVHYFEPWLGLYANYGIYLQFVLLVVLAVVGRWSRTRGHGEHAANQDV